MSNTLTSSHVEEKVAMETVADQKSPEVGEQQAGESQKRPHGQIPVADGLLKTPSKPDAELTPMIDIKNLCVSYAPPKKAIDNVSVTFYKNLITAVMGPSGCGKSTLLRAINRMHDLYPSIKTTGEILLDGADLMKMNAMDARRRAGMVFQQPNPFPTMTIAENVLSGYQLNGIKLSKAEKEEIVETSLRDVALWDEVKDQMKKKGSFLSGGQQQRLCIARAIALRPEVLLMDEPTSALDPISTNRVEELILELKKDYTIIIVTHNMSQAARLSDKSAFMYLGELIEYGDTEQMFTRPKYKQTEDYLTGVFS